MRKQDFDTKLLIYKSRRTALTLFVAIIFAVYMILLLAAGRQDVPWYFLILPVTAIGLIFLLIPPTEEWEYKPWQSKPRRIEQYNERSSL